MPGKPVATGVNIRFARRSESYQTLYVGPLFLLAAPSAFIGRLLRRLADEPSRRREPVAVATWVPPLTHVVGWLLRRSSAGSFVAWPMSRPAALSRASAVVRCGRRVTSDTRLRRRPPAPQILQSMRSGCRLLLRILPAPPSAHRRGARRQPATNAYAKTTDRPTVVDRSSGRQNDQLLVNAWYAAVSKSTYPVNEGPSANGKICVAQ
ncbi:hypothetical protein FB459_2746 [Yimella lutea]|uniref:Uncharacterized protein n=1 Tax=Yimella lutea TaxID=587872 RepID=A0A542EJ19_9MICO|nr:hypothetical protein FB459_2746 [Yimella lutea]